MPEFMNFDCLPHCCSKKFETRWSNCKHMLLKRRRRRRRREGRHTKKRRDGSTLHLVALMFDHKILTVLSTIGGLGAAKGADVHTHTHSARSGANLRGSLHWPRPDKVPVDETSLHFLLLLQNCAEASSNQLKDSGAKRWKPRSAELQGLIKRNATWARGGSRAYRPRTEALQEKIPGTR